MSPVRTSSLAWWSPLSFILVAALSLGGCGGGGGAAAVTPTPTAPGVPTGLVAVAGAGEVGLTWSAPAGDGGSAITEYVVYRRETTGLLTELGRTAAAVTSYADEGLAAGTTWVYAVAAVNEVGEGGQSDEASATALLFIVETVTVPAGTFTMGATDTEGGYGNEFPRHEVTLSSYDVGKFEVTNGEYAAVLNWALAKGYLKGDAAGNPYVGGPVYADGKMLLGISSPYCQIAFADGAFTAKSAPSSSVPVPMADHPVVMVSWYGAVAFCTWLSESAGLRPWYGVSSEPWELRPPLAPNGYRLPTEAEWERAAAWDGAAVPSPKHFAYGVSADTIDGTRCNYAEANPLGLSMYPYTVPVGSYDGRAGTLDSPSPVGCYDMCGSVWEWCHDWYALYTVDPQENPLGPSSGSYRLLRGGSWFNDEPQCRAAYRTNESPANSSYTIGFRVVVSPSGAE